MEKWISKIQAIMQGLVNYKTQLIRLVGVIAAIWLTWRGLSYAGVSSFTLKFTVVMLVGIAIVGFMIYRWWRVNKKGSALNDSMQKEDANSAGRQLEVSLLKERMGEAIDALKTSELGVNYRGSAALYVLPWYMIIGPSSSGKSTLLRNSGLSFPYPVHESPGIKGVGGTKNCDWWLSQQAIFLDTAGRYTSGDEDNFEWISFLSMVKKNRPKLPINGVIVALPVDEILADDSDSMQRHSLVMRQRINELYTHLGYQIPVYFVLTKCDLIAGFDYFFHHLNQQQRQQIVGIHQDSLDADSLANTLDALSNRINQTLLNQIHLHKKAKDRYQMAKFPGGFNEIVPKVKSFLNHLMMENPYQEMPNFKGIFITSGTQQSSELVNESSEKTSYFVKELLSDLIINAKQNLTKIKQKRQKQQYLKVASLLASTVFIVTSLMMYSASYTANSLLLRKGERVAHHVISTKSKKMTGEHLEALINATDFVDKLKAYKSNIPFYYRLGLYRGNKQLSLLSQLMQFSQQSLFDKPVIMALEYKLNRYHRQWQRLPGKKRDGIRGDYYSTLKVYLMMMYPNRMDSNFAVDTVSRTWHDYLKSRLHTDSLQIKTLSPLVLFYLQSQSEDKQIVKRPSSINKRLVLSARHDLYTRTNAYNYYSQIKTRSLHTLPAVSVTELIKASNSDILSGSVKLPGLYTKAAYIKWIKPQIEEMAQNAAAGDWVMDTAVTKLGDKASQRLVVNHKIKTQYLDEMTHFYIKEYLGAWLKLLKHTRVHSFASFDDGAEQLQRLADAKGPITELLTAMGENAAITKLIPQEINLNSIEKNLFKQISQLSKTGEDAFLPVYLAQISTLQSEIEKLAISPTVGDDAIDYSTALLSADRANNGLYRSSLEIKKSVRKIKSTLIRQAILPFLMSPVRQSWHIVLQRAGRQVDMHWQQQVYSIYKETLVSKFPFDLSGRDANLSDVADFFQLQQGILWQFYRTSLSTYFNEKGKKLVVKKWLGYGLPVDNAFINSLVEAKNISRGLFASNGSKLQFNYALYPHPSSEIKEILIQSDGRSYPYRNGPQEWIDFSWPHQQELSDTMIRISDTANRHALLAFDNAWGIFHLLAKAKLSHVQRDRLVAQWSLSLGKRKFNVILNVRSASYYNLFKQFLVDGFKLPRHLISHLNNAEVDHG